MPRSWLRRATSWFAGVLTACSILLACDSITNPGDDAVIVITYDTDTTVVVGTTIVPRFSVTVDGVVAPQPRLVLSSSNLSVISVSATGDSLFVNARGLAAITATLIGSTLADDPPAGSRTLHAVAAELHIAEHGVELDALGDTTTCRAVALGASGDTLSNVQATWFSANDSVASVNASGRVTANRNGSTEVFAVVDNDTASVGVSVAQRLAGFGFEPAPVILNSLGATAQLTATPRDAGDAEIPSGVVPDPAWSTANPGIASVTSEGLVTAVGNGETFIRAAGLDIVDSVRTEVRQVATRVSIFGPRAIELDALGDSVRLSAAGFDALDADVLIAQPTWTSRDLTVAQVDPSTGMVRALGVGMATVVARVDTAADSVTVTVSNVPTQLSITPDTLSFVSLDDTKPVLGTVRNKFGEVITGDSIAWKTSDTAIAAVTLYGIVTSKAIGTTQLVGTLENDVADTIEVVVSNEIHTVNIVPELIRIESVGDTEIPEADFRNALGAEVPRTAANWESRDPTVASVNPEGTILAEGRGSTWVLATNPNNEGASDSVRVEVLNTPESVELNLTNNTLHALNSTLQYEATVRNARDGVIDDEEVRWRSAPPGIVSVSDEGLATALAAGTATIIAEVGSGDGLRSDSASLTVVNTARSVHFSSAEYTITSVLDDYQLIATALNEDGGAVSGVEFDWDSSEPSIASVSPIGLVTSWSVGSTDVTASLKDGTANATIKIHVTNAPDTIRFDQAAQTLASIGDIDTPVVELINAVGASVARTNADWDSDDRFIATVTTDGIIEATGRGSTRVYARNPFNAAIADHLDITVTNAPTTVTLDPGNTTLTSYGETQTYTAVVRNANGDLIANEPITWSSSDGTVATISLGGIATAIGRGTTMITAECADYAGATSAPVALEVTNDAQSITVTPTSAEILDLGGEYRLTAVALNNRGDPLDAGDVTWTSLLPDTAAVDATGLVTATANAANTGTAYVVAATVYGGLADTAAVTVRNAPRNIEITLGSYSFDFIGQTHAVAATIENSAGEVLARDAVTWASSASQVAAVDAAGTVTALSVGTAVISATSPFDATDTDAITVTVANDPATVTIDQGNLTLTAYGATETYTAVVRNGNGDAIPNEPVTWTSSIPSVATISVQGGLATAVGRSDPDPTEVTATCCGGSITSSPVELEVTNDATSITVTPTNAEILDLDGTYQLTAVALNNRGNPLVEAGDITWNSSAPTTIATVDGNGLVTGVSNSTGTVTITAEAIGGPTDQASITVHNAPRTIAFSSHNDTLAYIGATFAVAATIQNSGADILPRTAVTWTSSAPQTASVDESGNVTAHGVGNAVISATSPFDPAETDTDTITVRNVPFTLELSPQGDVILTALNETDLRQAIVRNEGGDVITGHTIDWSTNNSAVASVSGGVVTAEGVGSTIVRAAVAGFPSATDAADVIVANEAATVAITPSSVLVPIGGTQQVVVEARNSLNDVIVDPTVTWEVAHGSFNRIDTTHVSGTSIDTLDITGAQEGIVSLRAIVDGVSRNILVEVYTPDDQLSAVFDRQRLRHTVGESGRPETSHAGLRDNH